MIKSGNTSTTVSLGIVLGVAALGAVHGAAASAAGARGAASQAGAQASAPAPGSTVRYSHIPLYFEANHGQAAGGVRFLSRGRGYALYLTDTGPLLALHRRGTGAGGPRAAHGRRSGAGSAVIAMKLVGANPRPRIRGRQRQRGTVNYLVGKDPKRWHRGIPTFGRVVYASVYPGIDLTFHGRQDRLEYDFDVAPGADPEAIRLSFSGADGMRVDRAGRLHLHTAGGDVIEKAPVAYQRIGGLRRKVTSRYVLTGAHQVTFALSAYDPAHALVIDPVLSFSSYLGGSGNDRALAIARDPTDGSIVYITGRTESSNFLSTSGVADPMCGTQRVSCAHTELSYVSSQATLDPQMWTDSGDVVRYDRLTLFTSAAKNAQTSVTTKFVVSGDFDSHVTMRSLDDTDKVTGMEVDIGGEHYAWGVSSSATAQQFELTAGNSAASCSSSAPPLTTDVTKTPFAGAEDVRVVRSQGTLTFYYRTPGTGQFAVGGTCTNASTAGATIKLFVTTATTTGKMSQFDGFSLTFSTAAAAQSEASATLGQSLNGDFEAHVTLNNVDEANKSSGIEVQIGGTSYDWGISSSATSQQFSLSPQSCSSSAPAISNVTAQDVEVVRRQGTLSFYYRPAKTILFTLAGTCTNVPEGAATFKLFVTTADATTKASAFDNFYAEQASGAPDAFVMRLDDGGKTLDYATYLGGSGQDQGLSIVADKSHHAFVAGKTYSADLPTTSGAFQTTCPDINGDLVCDNGGNAFVAELSADGQTLPYVTFFGGCYNDAANGIALDGGGNVYIAGYVTSAADTATSSSAAPCVSGFPVKSALALQPAFQTANHGRTDAFVAKLAPAGGGANDLIYSTFVGGKHVDEALAIAVSSAGLAYITGDTSSSDFPLHNPIACPQCDSVHYHAFVSEINADGTGLVYSTLLGGSAYDYGNAIALDGAGNAYVTGWTRSPDFPVSSKAVQPNPGGDYDVFFSKLNAAGSALVYSTYLGTTDVEAGQGIALDSGGDVWITGYSMAPDLLVALLRDVRPDLDAPLDFLQDYQSVDDPSSDTDVPGQADTDDPHNDQPNLNNYVLDNLSVSDLADNLNTLLGSSLNTDPSKSLAASEQRCNIISAVDASGLASLSRSSLICLIFDTVNGYVADALHPIQSSRKGLVSAFVLKLAPKAADDYSLDQATYLGGLHENYATGITVDDAGNPYVVGYTQADDFPVTGNALQPEYCPSGSPGDTETPLEDATETADESANACGEDGFMAKIVKGDVDLSVAMTKDAPDAVDPGTKVTYTMTVKNNSPTLAVSGVQLVDNVPIGLQLVSAAPADQCTPSKYDAATFNHTVTCYLGELKAGASTVVTLTVVTTAETESPTQNPGTTLPTGPLPQVVSATVTGLATDDVPGNNSASVKISVNETFIAPENTPHPALSQKFPTFQGIDPPGGGGGLGVLSLIALAAAARRRRIGVSGQGSDVSRVKIPD